MGVSASSNQVPPPPGGKPGGNSPGLGQHQSAPETAWTSHWKNVEPRVILANNSDYIVSYWVIEEDKKKTKAQQQRIASSIGRQLNASCSRSSSTTSTTSSSSSNTAVGSCISSGDVKKPSDEETLRKQMQDEEEEAQDEVYYLMRDHRMGRKGSTQPTQVPFPANCKHVRLLGFFERDGEWQRYKDKVYSIALRNKNFRITASTSSIAPYSNKNKATKPRGKQMPA